MFLLSWITVIGMFFLCVMCRTSCTVTGAESGVYSLQALSVWSTVYITSSGVEEKTLCDCGSGAVMCGWCIVHRPGDVSPAGCDACWGFLTFKDQNIKRTSVTSLMMCPSVSDNVSPNRGALDLISELLDGCCEHYYSFKDVNPTV